MLEKQVKVPYALVHKIIQILFRKFIEKIKFYF